MGIKIPICQNIKHKYTYNKRYTCINKPVFVFIVIFKLLDNVCYAWKHLWVQTKLTWVTGTDIHSF